EELEDSSEATVLSFQGRAPVQGHRRPPEPPRCAGGMRMKSVQCMTAVRMLLETFVRQGWDEAIQFVERLEDMFR
ncbi:hypothetical protein, partial [Nonomuraea sp. SBT364]|uniref:hypothetical protein n=1 Tax=Nonomuraea sp. SBT364 TaxID=1580530 RepID=UPI001E32420B